MGLKQDIINAKVAGLLVNGIDEEVIDTSKGSAIEVESELIKEAIVNFLTKVNFTITELNAPVVLEDFRIPQQPADVQPTVMVAPGLTTVGSPSTQASTTPAPLQGGTNGVLTQPMNIGKDAGGLDSTGYVFIGDDPDSQGGFDVSDNDGQIEFTKVKLIKENIDRELL